VTQVAIMTDSTVDLSPELLEQYDVHVVPLHVLIDGRSYVDGVDILPEEVARLMRDHGCRPTTSQPSPGDAAEVLRRAGAGGRPVCAIHLAGGLSGTLQSVRLASELVPEVEVEIVDSGSASMAMGFAVLEAAKAAVSGAGLAQVAECAREAVRRLHTFITVGSLAHLERIGRIGRLRAFLGSLLDIRPIIDVYNSELSMHRKVRTHRAVIPALVEAVRERVPFGNPLRCAVRHIDAAEEARRLRDALAAHWPLKECTIAPAASVLCAAVGPGSYGVFFWGPRRP